jgi:hypothetical protein
MVRSLIAGLGLGLLVAGAASPAGASSMAPGFTDAQHPLYLQIIVKACHRAGMSLEPVNEAYSYDDEKPMSIADRKAALVALDCIDVPIPMEWMSGEMTPEACRGHAGYLAAMRFLDGRQDLAEFPAVGAWGCIVTDYQVIGAINQ